jgi:hypothetical protein
MSSPRNSPEWRIFLIRFFLDLKQRSRVDVEYVTDLKSVPFQDRPCDLDDLCDLSIARRLPGKRTGE